MPKPKRAVGVSLWLIVGAHVYTSSLASSNWSATLGSVTQVYSHDSVYFVNSTISDGPCGSPGKFWWPISDPDAKDMYAMALAAFIAGKKIRVVYNYASPNCSSGGALITHMVISD